jgi:hypothetical protein
MVSESTALTAVDPIADELAAFGISEGESFTPSNLHLVQPVEIEDHPDWTAGKYMDTQSNLTYDTITIVPILIRLKGKGEEAGGGRVLFPPKSESGCQPLCKSVDGVKPMTGEGLTPQDGGRGCAKCPKSQWLTVGGKSVKPPCQENGTFLFAELSTSFVFRMNIKGMALTPAKDFKETLRKLVTLSRVKGSVTPPYGMTFTLSTVKVKSSQGSSYYLPKFTPSGLVNPGDVAHFRKIYKFFTAKKVEESGDPVEKLLEGEYLPQGGDEPQQFVEA